jgi:hypothetical protein
MPHSGDVLGSEALSSEALILVVTKGLARRCQEWPSGTKYLVAGPGRRERYVESRRAAEGSPRIGGALVRLLGMRLGGTLNTRGTTTEQRKARSLFRSLSDVLALTGPTSLTSLDLHRLTVLLGASTIALYACSQRDRSGVAQWFFRVDTIRSELDGTTRLSTTLEIFGKEGPEGSPRTQVVGLHFGCQRGSGASGALVTDDLLETGSVQVRINRDTLPLYSSTGIAGGRAGGGLVLLDNWAAFLDSLRGHQVALVEYQNTRRYSRTVAEFRIAGIDSVRALFLAACAKR